MTPERLMDGKAFATHLRARIAKETARLKVAHGLIPGLAAVLVGEDAASQVYVRNKERQTIEVGMKSLGETLPQNTPEEDLINVIEKLNNDTSVHGILVQLPLPIQIDPNAVIDSITPAKDVDGFHTHNVGLLATGRNGMVACTPLGCMILLTDRLGDLSGLNAVIVGRSNIVGKPLAQLLLKADCTVTIAHSRTCDLPKVCRDADILIAAVGRPEIIRGDWVKPGATVIDVGINRVVSNEDGKARLVGDVAFDEVIKHAGAITPVPGGVGPMTIACLLRNTLIATCEQNNIQAPDI